MSNYLAWDKICEPGLSDIEISKKYEDGYVLTRENNGAMYQSRSLRINLEQFIPNSENRRILTKMEGLRLETQTLPLGDNYDWNIHKLGKDYYESKFGPKVFTANKIRELLTTENNFNTLLKYSVNDDLVGYCICYDNESLRHYAYPFYDLTRYANNYGMGMMLLAIQGAKECGKKYAYLGSVTRPGDIYKLQFSGLEWFDGSSWQSDLDVLKSLLNPV